MKNKNLESLKRDYNVDVSRARLKPGDIILIPDKKIFPKTSRNQFAVVLRRYKIKNYVQKWDITFWHYGSEIMYLTGLKRGQIRNFSSKLYDLYKIDPVDLGNLIRKVI